MPAFEPQALPIKAANAVVLAELPRAAYGKYDDAKAAADACGLKSFTSGYQQNSNPAAHPQLRLLYQFHGH